MDRNDVAQAAKNLNAVRRAVTRAMRRTPTYKAAMKEFVTTGLNVAMYPSGLVSRTFVPDQRVTFSGRFSSQLPLRYLEPEAANTPIILVHGYFHNRSAFTIVRRALRRSGFRNVTTLNYNVIGHDVRELAGQLAAHVDRVIRTAGSSKVHIIGHSLGGIIARTYIQYFGGEDKVHTCITLGTPHRGTYSALFSRGRAVRDIRPSSELIAELQAPPASNVRYVSYYSNLDVMVVPASSAKLEAPNLRVRNVLIKDQGHMSLLISQSVITSIIDSLWHLDEEREPRSPDAKQA
ncbi:MAG: esterase/lipase family protein [Actinomycetota bacterium]